MGYILGLNSHSSPRNGKLFTTVEIVCNSLFVVWMTCLCRLLPSCWHVLMFLLLSHAVAGLLHIQITISHFSMEMYNGVTYKNDDESWLHTQLATTMDVDCPTWLDWFHIGLQFQAAHHLFPRVPRHNLRKLREQFLLPFCKKHGLRYLSLTWFDCIRGTVAQMMQVAYEARKQSPKSVAFRDTLLFAGFNAEG